ncbi:MAG TPA: hypothetical protein VGO46_09180 [Gemmatimonadaceae bacterium]|nr:hypothetical protein [Gemmatimonadaceae bacterium]
MTDRPVPPEMETGELAVHIVSDQGANDHVLLLARGAGGVRVREWHPGNWSKGPDESVVSASALLARLEGVVRTRQRVDPDVRTVREWLAATPR